MSRTRKIGGRRRTHRRKTMHSRRNMKGGGRLDRLPVGPGSRNESGNPIRIDLPGVGGAGAGAGGVASTYLGTPEALEKGRANAHERIALLNNAEVTAKQIHNAIRLLPSNMQHTYISPAEFKVIADKYDTIKEKYGIVVSSLPEANVGLYPIPEVLERLEIIKSVDKDFTNNWDFTYICGHGVLAPDLPSAVVPPRTYIRFHSPAGCLASISGEKTGLVPIMAFPDVFTKGSKEAFVREMVQSYFKNVGPLESFSSKAQRNALIAEPLPPGFCTTPNNPNSEASACLAPHYQKQTLYMPGEHIPQMTINFKNNPYQTIILGIYDLPMDYHFYTGVQGVAEAHARSGKPLHDMTDAELRAAIQSQDLLDKQLFKNRKFDIRTDEGRRTIDNPNKNPGIIGQRLTLTQVLDLLPAVPAGKVRFLFINSCRGVPRVMNDTGLVTNIRGAWNGGAGAGAGAAAAAAAAAGGAGGPPPPKRPLNVSQRSEIAKHFRRFSLGNQRAIENQRIYEQLVEARRYMKTHNSSDPHYAEKAAFDSEIMRMHGDIWMMAVTAVP